MRLTRRRDRDWIVAAVAVIGGIGCRGAAAPPPDAAPAEDAATASTGPLGVGSVGAAACVSADDCRASCQERAVARATPKPAVVTFPESVCKRWGQDGNPQANGCECRAAGGSAHHLHPYIACTTFGRGYQCLYAGSEFPGCSLDAASTSCKPACDELAARLSRESEQAYAVSVKDTRCTPGACDCVVKVGDRCYVEGSYHAYDCALSLDAIVTMEHRRINMPGGVPGIDALPARYFTPDGGAP